MAEVLLDTLGLARRLRDRAGFSPEHAEEAAQAIADAFSGPVATRGDLIELRSGVRADLQELRTEVREEMSSLASELRGEMSNLASELRGEVPSLAGELRGEMSSLASELRGEMSSLAGELRGQMSGLRDDLVELRTSMDRRFEEQRLATKADLADLRSDMTRLVLTVATGQVALLLAAMFSLVRLGH